MNIVVHIDRLVLDGVALAPHEHARLQAALQDELGRLLAEGGIGADFRAGGARPMLRGGSVEVGAAGNGAELGAQIAQAVYGGIGVQE